MWYIYRHGKYANYIDGWRENRLFLTNKPPIKSNIDAYSNCHGVEVVENESWVLRDSSKCYKLPIELYPEVTYKSGYKIINDIEAQSLI